MKITQLHLKNFQQFKDLKLDFTHPETGEPLDRVCFIGQNGTGKTTILNSLFNASDQLLTSNNGNFNNPNVDINLFNKHGGKDSKNITTTFKFKSFGEPIDLIQSSLSSTPVWNYNIEEICNYINNERTSQSNLLTYIVSEGQYFNRDIPKSSVNDALKLFNNFTVSSKISGETVSDFWTLLIYHIKKREDNRNKFENLPENLNKTKRQLIEEFDTNQPKILFEIAKIWDRVLGNAGLFFDIENVKSPIQLHDNLIAYIKSKATDKVVPYSRLSTGIKNFIFQLGHLFALHFNREIDNNFLLIDEPSNGLYPDYAYELIGLYESVVTPNTQMFVATHNPIIAAQFHPYERFILEFNKEDYISVKKGVSPIGDDPVDILEDDFLVRNIMPKEGMEAWQRFVNLKREIHYLNKQKPFKNGEQEKLNNLIEEMSTIGRKYNF